MCLLNSREESLKRLDELNEICDTCITIKYNIQMFGEIEANEHCVFRCPLAKHFQEVGNFLVEDTKRKRESSNEKRENGST